MQNVAKKRRQYTIFFSIVGVFIFLYFLFLGKAIEEVGFMDAVIGGFNSLSFTITKDSFVLALVVVALYYIFAFSYILEIGNYRFGEEHGTAKWASVFDLAKKYRNKTNPDYVKVLTKNFALSYDNDESERNSNTIVFGGSGAGKTFRYAMPNLLQCATSFVDIDPKGEHLAKAGKRLIKLGYDVKVLNLISLSESDGYNPFKYIRETEAIRDIEALVQTLFIASQGGRGKSQDPFWDDSAKNVILSFMYYVYYEYPPSRRHFGSIVELKQKANIKGNTGVCDYDFLIKSLAARKPDSLAVKYWNEYAGNDIKVKRDILAVVSTKLGSFQSPDLVNMTRFDDMDFDSLGERKRVIFIVISDTDTSMNFIVSMMYTQLFQRLFSVADIKYKGGLPIHVHIMMDEFANIKLPDDFEKVLATMRSRNVSASIILQNQAQIKGLYEKQWESIIGNCDTLLYLGGNEVGTAEYVSKLLGKYTLDTKSYTRSFGKGGSGSENKSNIARDLLSPDELRKLPNDECILLIRGEDAVRDYKSDPRYMKASQYSVYDKVEGGVYIREVRDLFSYKRDVFDKIEINDFDFDEASKINASVYSFVTSDELKKACESLLELEEKSNRRRH